MFKISLLMPILNFQQEKDDQNKLRGGQPIRLFHKEIEAYLVAEGLFDDETTEEGQVMEHLIALNIS